MSYPLPLGRITDANGKPVPAKLYVYDAITTAPTSVYLDTGLSNAAANPLSSDASGLFVPLYAKPGSYRFVVTDTNGNVLYEFNNYDVPDTSGIGTLNLTLTLKTSNYTLATSDRATILKVDASGAPGSEVTITANSATMANGFPTWIINAGASGTVVVQPGGGQTINGASDVTLDRQYAGIGMVSEGSGGWLVFTNTGGIFTGNVNFTGNMDVDGTFNVDGLARFNAAIVRSIQTLSDGANVAWDMEDAADAQVTWGGNRTMDAPTNQVATQTGFLRTVQDGTGGRLPTWASDFKFPGGNDAKPGRSAAAETIYWYYVQASGRVLLRKIWASDQNAIGFYREYDKGATATSTTYTQAHGLGRYPAAVQVWMECTTTEFGYAVGARILIDGGVGDGGGAARMVMTAVDSTNVEIITGSTLPLITRKDTNATGTITAANWKIIVRIFEA